MGYEELKGYRGGEDPRALARHLERLGPYLVAEIGSRTPGVYPAIDAAGPPAERLVHAIYHRDVLGEGVWERYGDAIEPAARELLAQEIAAFDVWVAGSAHAAMQSLGPWHERTVEIMTILDLFGAHVGREVANGAWQLGYACALSRVVNDPNGARALAPPEDVDVVVKDARVLFAHPLEHWVGVGLHDPINANVILDCVTYLTDQTFTRLGPLVGGDGERQARVDLRWLTLRGFGLGRLQVEPAFRRIVQASPDATAAERGGRTLEEIVPADARAALESAGAVFALDPAKGSISIGLNGFSLARIDATPPKFTWTDDALGTFLRQLVEYEQKARLLQDNRGRDTFALRAMLRDGLGMAQLLDAATAARCTASRKGTLTVKGYYLSHPAFGQFARVDVLRGQSHVVDVAFSSPKVFVPIRFLVAMELSLGGLRRGS